MANNKTRDFIYLDIERIRSIVAQNAGGLTSERQSESQHTVGGKVSGEGGIPFFAKASGEADYHYHRSRSETMSLHDYIFSEFANLLENAGVLSTSVVPLDEAWSETTFVDGRFMIVRGILKIVDYEYAVEFLRTAPSMEKAINKLQSSSSTTTSNSGTNKNKVKPNAQSSLLASQPLQDISSLVEQFFKGAIRVKILPFANDPSKVFVGTADRDLFRYSPAALTNLYGPVIDADWVSVLLINRGISYKPGQLISKTGNDVEDGLEQMVDFASQLGNMVQGVKFPAVAVTPIAIYREL